MSILQSIIDNVGDALGTSKLARLNRHIFQPVIGTAITRREYDMCNGADIIGEPTKRDYYQMKGLKGGNRREMANCILDLMVDNGTVFSDNRIVRFAALQQYEPGTTSLSWKVRDQLSPKGENFLDEALHQSGIAHRLRY